MSKKTTKARVFVPLVKVDEENRLVHGRITQEILDKSGEVMDYTTSKPLFEKWSQGISDASGGLSKGNVRVMHGLTAAGKLTELEFDDTEKAIDVCAKIVDDQEWEKVVEGVYTGFSVGGSYAKRWTETGDAGAKIKKYTADPNEVSLVDNACVPTATFQFAKADGTVENIAFQVENDDEEWPGFAKADTGEQVEEPKAEVTPPAAAPAQQGELPYNPPNPVVAKRAEELQKAANTGDWMDFIPQAREQLIEEHSKLGKADAVEEGAEAKEGEAADAAPGTDAPKADDAPAGTEPKVEKTTPPGISQKWVTSDGEAFEKKADAEAHEAKLEKADSELSDADRLRKALQRVTGEIDEAEEAREEPTVFSDLDRLHKAFCELELPRDAATGGPALEKGMYTVSRFARMIGDVAELTRTIKAEGVLEGDDGEDANVSGALKASLSGFGENFITYATQQVGEILKGIDVDCTPVACYDYYYRAAQADPENTLAKDVCSLIDAAKEELGEDYDPSEETLAKRAPVESEEVVPLAKFNKLESDYDALKKVAEDAIEQMDGLAKRVKVIEDTPMPRAPRGAGVEKGGDGSLGKGTHNDSMEKLAVVREMVELHGADGLATLLIKAAQTKPQHMGGGR